MQYSSKTLIFVSKSKVKKKKNTDVLCVNMFPDFPEMDNKRSYPILFFFIL